MGSYIGIDLGTTFSAKLKVESFSTVMGTVFGWI